MLLLMLDPSDPPVLSQSETQPADAADACLVRPLDQQLWMLAVNDTAAAVKESWLNLSEMAQDVLANFVSLIWLRAVLVAAWALPGVMQAPASCFVMASQCCCWLPFASASVGVALQSPLASSRAPLSLLAAALHTLPQTICRLRQLWLSQHQYSTGPPDLILLHFAAVLRPSQDRHRPFFPLPSLVISILPSRSALVCQIYTQAESPYLRHRRHHRCRRCLAAVRPLQCCRLWFDDAGIVLLPSSPAALPVVLFQIVTSASPLEAALAAARS